MLLRIGRFHIFFYFFMFYSALASAAPYEGIIGKYKSGNYDEAFSMARDYLAKNPGDEKMWSSFITMLDNQKRYKDVKQNALNYLKIHGSSPSKHRDIIERYLVESWVQTKDYDLVEPFVSKLLVEKPNHKYRNDLLFMDAKACLWNKSYAKSYEKYYKLANSDPNDGICRLSKFYAAYSSFLLADDMGKNGEDENLVTKQYQDALDLFMKFRKANTNNESLLARTDVRVIQCYRKLGKYDSLDEEVKNALPKPVHQANRDTLLYEHGESFFERQQWNRGLECYNSYLNVAKKTKPMLKAQQEREDLLNYHRVLCLLNTGNDAAFEQAATEYLGKNPDTENSARISYAKAMIPYNKQNWPASKSSLQAYLSMNPKAPDELKSEAEYNLVNSMVMGNECEQAKKYVQKKLTEEPDCSGRQEMQFLAAIADYKSGKWSEASATLCKLIEQSPEGEAAAIAKIYAGICNMNEARQQQGKDGGANKAKALRQDGRKYLLDWARNEKPIVQTDMDALYYQGDFTTIKNQASKYLETGDSSNMAKRAQMLNWMGIVSINQDPPDLQKGKKYFDQAYQASRQDMNLARPEAVKASLWKTWIALYNDDQKQARDILKEIKSLPESKSRAEVIKRFQYVTN